MEQLKHLDLSTSHLDDSELLRFASLPSLQVLNLNNCSGITIGGLAAFLKEKRNLKRLIVELDPSTIKAICQLQIAFPNVVFKDWLGKPFRTRPRFARVLAKSSHLTIDQQIEEVSQLPLHPIDDDDDMFLGPAA